jgi:chromosome partitioning protein
MAKTPPKSPVVIAVTNAKGGVGKTTSVACIGADLAQRGHRVLLIDADWQSDLTNWFNCDPAGRSLGEVLLSQADIVEAIQPLRTQGEPFPNLFLLPASNYLAVQEYQIREVDDYHELLKKKLAAVAKQYDYVLIDCPPAQTTMTYMAFVAATAYVVPSKPEKFSYDKQALIAQLAQGLRESGVNPKLKALGVFFLPYNPRSNRRLHQQVVQITGEDFGPDMVLPNIRQDGALSDSQAFGTLPVSDNPDSNGVQDFHKLTSAILAKLV